MKVSRDNIKVFNPVNIKLETREELESFDTILRLATFESDQLRCGGHKAFRGKSLDFLTDICGERINKLDKESKQNDKY